MKTFLPNSKTKRYSTDTVPYKAAQTWSTRPTSYKNLNLSSLDLFKSEIKKLAL